MPEQKNKTPLWQKSWVQSLAIFVAVFGILGIFAFWQFGRGVVSIDNSYLDAPIATIAPTTSGTLNAVYVKEGDTVAANTAIAQVGSETLFTEEGGIVTDVPQVLGSYIPAGQTVARVVVTEKMRVVGSIDEDKGLDAISPGQRATFTVDAFPGRTYEGVVYEISPTSNQVGIAFSISDARPVRQFNVYVRFDWLRYPELLSGMSARIRVYTK